MIPIPPMPQLEDFPGHEYGYNTLMFQQAMFAWERVAKEVIAANLKASQLLAEIKPVREPYIER